MDDREIPDDQFRRQAAIKLIRPEMLEESTRRRFENGVDPRVGDAGAGRIVDGYEVDFVFYLFERSLHGVCSMLTTRRIGPPAPS